MEFYLLVTNSTAYFFFEMLTETKRKRTHTKERGVGDQNRYLYEFKNRPCLCIARRHRVKANPPVRSAPVIKWPNPIITDSKFLVCVGEGPDNVGHPERSPPIRRSHLSTLDSTCPIHIIPTFQPPRPSPSPCRFFMPLITSSYQPFWSGLAGNFNPYLGRGLFQSHNLSLLKK